MTRIAVIGSGNVASALAPALGALPSAEVVQVWTRRGTEPLSPDADIYLISVSDDAIAEVARRFAGHNPGAVWAHTSGSVGMEALAPTGPRHGVFYPLQTFSKGRRVEVSSIPVFVEGSTPDTTAALKSLAASLTSRVYDADSASRRAMHVAAVFGCNFANHLWALADDLLRQQGLTFDILGPLLRETLDKALETSPADGQTGPARRGDSRVIGEHVASLPPDLAAIYRTLSDHITERYSK